MRSYLFAILIIFSSTVLAGGPETVYGLSGECQKAIAFDKSMSAASCSKVMVSEWQDGRVGFLFLLQGKGEDSVFIYAFIGNGPEQIQKIANAAIQPINHVNVTFDGETSTHIAVGACEFDNPFNGTPARIFCTVETSDGKFVGEFISDGREPVSIR